MTLRFEQILAEGIAQTSYLVGDDAEGTAAVVDPRPDAEIYLDLARHFGLTITHVLETHIHADFMSGARELVDRLGGSAELCVSEEGGAEYDFPHRRLRPGERLPFGAVELEVVATPGHTPEHVSFLLRERDREQPWGILSGDSFFVDSVGRPDLLGDEQTEELTRALFRTLHEVYRPLPDGTIVYPCHGAGSECGPAIGDRTSTTIGFERQHNTYFAIDDYEEFRQAMQADAPPVPTHYPRLKKVNAAGPAVLGNLPRVPALGPGAFAAAARGGRLVDTRDMLAFGGGHIAGAINIGGRPDLSVWAGWLLDPDQPLFLVLDDDTSLARIVTLLWRVGFTRFGGYLAGGMAAWQEAGQPLRHLSQLTVHELCENPGLLPLDVRKEDEWEGGHVPGARHLFLGELPDRMQELDRDQPIATYCASGFRASIAASLLAASGFDVRNVPGSWKAWRAAGFDVAKE
jgi:hydroxyacylglutathione hydrolase